MYQLHRHIHVISTSFPTRPALRFPQLPRPHSPHKPIHQRPQTHTADSTPTLPTNQHTTQLRPTDAVDAPTLTPTQPPFIPCPRNSTGRVHKPYPHTLTGRVPAGHTPVIQQATPYLDRPRARPCHRPRLRRLTGHIRPGAAGSH